MDDEDTLARTLWGEARGEGIDGMTAVACVVLNRQTVSVEHPGYWWGTGVANICTKPQQFSCWNHNDPNYELLIKLNDTDASFRTAQALAKTFLEKGVQDITNGATHYCTDAVSPAWAAGEHITAHIGHHLFYRPKEVPPAR